MHRMKKRRLRPSDPLQKGSSLSAKSPAAHCSVHAPSVVRTVPSHSGTYNVYTGSYRGLPVFEGPPNGKARAADGQLDVFDLPRNPELCRASPVPSYAPTARQCSAPPKLRPGTGQNSNSSLNFVIPPPREHPCVGSGARSNMMACRAQQEVHRVAELT